MKLTSLFILIAAIILGGVLYYIGSKPDGGLADANSYLIPNLSEKLNDVTKLTIHKAGNEELTTVSKAENTWVVENKDGYTADIGFVRSVFNKLAEAKLVEAKTSNPENYSKLGVQDIEKTDAQGVMLAIEGLSETINIIAGNKGSVGNNTQYMRRVGEEQSWLINQNLDLKQDATRWLKKDILDITPERIKSIQIDHGDGNIINIKNEGTEEFEFVLQNSIPEGRKISESEVYQVANALSSLQLIDVALLDNLNIEAVQPIKTTFLTYDGLTITADTYSIEEQMYSKLNIEFNAENVDESKLSNKNNAEELAKKATSKIAGWAYVFPSITADALVKKLDNFLLAEDDEA